MRCAPSAHAEGSVILALHLAVSDLTLVEHEGLYFMFFCDLLRIASYSPRRNQARRAPGGWRKKKKINPRYRYGKISSGANAITDRRRKPLPRKPGQPRSAHPRPFVNSQLRFQGSAMTSHATCVVPGYAMCVDACIVAAIQKRNESDR